MTKRSSDESQSQASGWAVISRQRLAELLDQMDWYRRCLEDVQDGRVVRGLDEAQTGYDSAHNQLRRFTRTFDA